MAGAAGMAHLLGRPFQEAMGKDVSLGRCFGIDMINMSRTQKKRRTNGGRNSCSGQQSSNRVHTFSKGCASNELRDPGQESFQSQLVIVLFLQLTRKYDWFPLLIFTLKISLLPLYKSKAYRSLPEYSQVNFFKVRKLSECLTRP